MYVQGEKGPDMRSAVTLITPPRCDLWLVIPPKCGLRSSAAITADKLKGLPPTSVEAPF